MSTSESNLTISSIFDVRDKIALVTGGGSGLGTMMASALIQNGAKVYIASRKEKQLQEARLSIYLLKIVSNYASSSA
ncbi:hypothetical protein FRB93_011363 [Tulasnella sp. JGI-2019a]|nr:hypothetical protein FRB93_011363 [Tulasnella sp. JGI-2019a]